MYLISLLTTHSFHIVDPSPWPFLTSFAALYTVYGLTLYRHSFVSGISVFCFGLIGIIYFLIAWWRDVIREATYEGHHTLIVQQGLSFGRALFIVSEIRLFFAFFWAFFHVSLNPSPFIGGIWPPQGIIPRDPWLIPLLNTTLLLTSGASLTWSHSAIIAKPFSYETSHGLIITIILAIIFTLFQVYEYFNASFTLSDGVYGSTFYRLTGLHGFHVIVGTIFLLVCLYRTIKHQFTTIAHTGYNCAAWYWHFVDVVWLFLFIVIYLWGNSSNIH